MTLQEALLALGEKPLTASPYSSAIRAITLAGLGKKGADIDKETPGYIVLSKIYAIANEGKRNALLDKQLGVVRSTDFYKQVVLGGSAVIAIVAIVIAMAVVYSDATVNPELTDVLKMAVKEFFDLLKLIITQTSGTTDASTPAA